MIGNYVPSTISVESDFFIMLHCRCLGHYGYIGNQMFQYASLLGIADRNQMEYCVDMEHWKRGGFQPHLWHEFNLSAKHNSRPPRHGYSEAGFYYQESTEDLFEETDVHGYFQTEKYFKHIESKIRTEFAFRHETRYECDKYLQQLNLKNNAPVVGVHVRRGDYLNLPQFHPNQTLEYYSKAREEFPDHQFVVVSDDRQWCKENMNMEVFEGSTPFADMCLLSLCDHNIIGNSSFSWWGSWLNKNPKKKVVAPKQWFGPAFGNVGTKDLIPKEWIQL